MRDRNFNLLILVILIAAVALWIDWPGHNTLKLPLIKETRDISVRLGLDLQGGTQVLLEADVPETTPPSADAMEAARTIVENRVNGLGVTEALVQLQGDRRIIVELPGIKDPDQAIATLRQTGRLEFIDSETFIEPGTVVKTTFGASLTEPVTPTVTPTTEATATGAPTGTVTETGTTTPTVTPTPTPEIIYKTVMTGKDLKRADVGFDNMGKPVIEFELQPESAQLFANHTAANVGRYLAIVLDNVVISCPVIKSAIPDGRGVIEGNFTLDEARSLAIQLKYGALPVPLKVVDNRTVGATLGADSVRQSTAAGIIGVIVVLLFMVTYYRLPGLMAALALILYGLLNFMVYKLIPVTLTLPGIAGFLLSIGMAVDANILVFERMKEEIRAGRSLESALAAGFDRAWTSIRDSNISTLITCAILYIFGSNFGASIVKGFAITLGLGVIINIFTAITVTRTFLRTLFDAVGERIEGKHWLMGV
ncbi:MAG: protein translocase subunit SecD [Anaerolineales bacterium]